MFFARSSKSSLLFCLWVSTIACADCSFWQLCKLDLPGYGYLEGRTEGVNPYNWLLITRQFKQWQVAGSWTFAPGHLHPRPSPHPRTWCPATCGCGEKVAQIPLVGTMSHSFLRMSTCMRKQLMKALQPIIHHLWIELTIMSKKILTAFECR